MQGTIIYGIVNDDITAGVKRRAYAKADFNSRPDDNGGTVGICLEIFDGEDSDDLNDGHEESCGKHSHKDQLTQEVVVRI